VNALEKRPDGVVDVDPSRCIGCKACLQGCPYDALYLHPDEGTAEKCHFCVHRTERGLAPACAVVCPTEAIVPGDFHDPESRVSRLRREHDLRARKTEAGTGPNVLYLDVAPAGIDPGRAAASGGYLFANGPTGLRAEVEAFRTEAERPEARTTYDVPREAAWGWKVSLYLLVKSIAAGLALPLLHGATGALVPAAALLFLAATAALLVLDLGRPERFWRILRHPNWSSWLARGTVVLGLYGANLAGWTVAGALGLTLTGPFRPVVLAMTLLLAAATAGYSAFLFGQAKGRVLWMRRGLFLHLLFHAMSAGAAAWILLLRPADLLAPAAWLAAGLLGALASTWLEGRAAPAGRGAEYARAHRLLTEGPFARRRRLGLLGGTLLPLVLLAAAGLAPGAALPLALAASALALLGVWNEEDVFVRAGQALPIS
jgi:ferredoxin